jgi:hypothetical protein
MPLVNRLLDVFFRTLDTVDAARERIDRVLGRSPQPDAWTTEWSPTPPSPPLYTPSAPFTPPATRARVRRAPATKKKAKKSSASVPKSAGKKAKGSGNRKGSVDRSGKDFDSPRARAIVEHLRSDGIGVITETAALDGKRVRARVLWALGTADKAGSELGLTAADASALLHLAAGVEVFATNVARTCRDETAFIEESAPDGRSKRYKLTAAGRAAAAKLDVRVLQ